jgi:carbohydrate-selective porin OprB
VPGDEQVMEAYYNLFLTDHLSVSGNVEWLIHGPNQVTGGVNNNVVIPGIRAVVVF